MPHVGTEKRDAEVFRELYLGDLATWMGLITDVIADEIEGVDLSIYDEVRLLLYIAGESTARRKILGVVQTDASLLYQSVQARVQFSFVPVAGNGFVAGTDYLARVVGVTGGTIDPLSKPWDWTAYAAGPSDT